jgi:ribosomal subunit interface protein
MDLEIQSQHASVQPAWRDLIAERADALSERYPKLLRLHVTFKHDAHHRQGVEAVHVVANVAGSTLSVTKEKEDALDALHAALDVVERELGRHR